MSFDFRLPPEWIIKESNDQDAYLFFHRDSPGICFSLTATQIERYADNPIALGAIVKEQMDAFSMAQLGATIMQNKHRSLILKPL